MKQKTITFTPSLFFQYATCPHWIWHDKFTDPKDKGEVPELTQKLLEQGVLHEEEFISKYNVSEVTGQGEAVYQATLALMKKGEKYIYQGAIRMKKDNISYHGRPDLLVKKPGNSKFGNYYYTPIDIKNSQDIKPTHIYQLTLYAKILESIQNYLPTDAGIINSEQEKIELEITETNIAETLQKADEIISIMEGKKPPLKLVSKCKASPWFNQCVEESEKKKDISLIYKLDSRSLTMLRENGINTIHDLARADITKIPKIPFLSEKSLLRANIQAQSLVENKVKWLDNPQIPSAPLKIYFDIEGDPLLQVEYLFGFWVSGDKEKKYAKIGNVRTYADTDNYYLYFLAPKPEDEELMWNELHKWIKLLPKDKYLVYHFADYERTKTNHLSEMYGSSSNVDKFLDSLIDLYKVVQKSVVFPLYFYSIKDIAKSPFLNYKWRHPKAGGAQSIFWYEKWLETQDTKVLNDIISYNEDDVIATEYLHNWLLEHKQKM
ncbi:MAG: TM0106 family RecB-like putative nuclease [bacterium]|nr:TM0106 family RecB-like putative nuclease [bacterium]